MMIIIIRNLFRYISVPVLTPQPTQFIILLSRHSTQNFLSTSSLFNVKLSKLIIHTTSLDLPCSKKRYLIHHKILPRFLLQIYFFCFVSSDRKASEFYKGIQLFRSANHANTIKVDGSTPFNTRGRKQEVNRIIKSPPDLVRQIEYLHPRS